MAFKLKGFPQHKGVNSSKPGPPQTTKFTHNWDGVDESKNTLERGSTGLTENKEFGGDATSLIQKKKEENDAIKEVTDGKGVKKDADGNPITSDDDNTTGGTAGAELKTTSDKYNPDGTLKEDDKKWHEKDAFRNTGIGHITDAVKSIRRGILKNKAKRRAKKASMDIDPTTGGIKLDTKKQKRKFRKNTVTVNGRTYSKPKKGGKKSNVKTEDYSDYTTEELMKRKENPNYRKTR